MASPFVMYRLVSSSPRTDRIYAWRAKSSSPGRRETVKTDFPFARLRSADAIEADPCSGRAVESALQIGRTPMTHRISAIERDRNFISGSFANARVEKRCDRTAGWELTYGTLSLSAKSCTRDRRRLIVVMKIGKNLLNSTRGSRVRIDFLSPVLLNYIAIPFARSPSSR